MRETLLFDRVTKYLIQKYNCHTVILHGSYSTGDFTQESDLDIVCFSDNTEDKNDVEVFKGIQLDVWIYDTEKMANPEQFLHINSGKILEDKKGCAKKFLLNIEDIFKNGPDQPSNEEKDFLKAWLRKMYLRSNKNDIEGNYRFHWMLKDSLEIYFALNGLWYLGPKKSLIWLRENDEAAYSLFNNALSKNAKKNNIEELLEYMNGM